MKFCLFPLLMIAILACPFRCMLAMASYGDDVEVGARTCCCCCTPKAADPGSEDSPEAPANDTSCSDCLCEGAVVAEEPVDLHLDDVTNVLASLDLVLSLQHESEDSRESWSEAPPGQSLSGISLCIQHELLLI